MKLRISVYLSAVWLALLIACSSNNHQGNPFTLPSGRVIRITGMGPLHYTNGNAPSLMFQYQTELKISEKEELLKEVDDIWSVLRVDADKGNFTSAIVSAREIPQGFIFKNAKGFNFVYEKNPDGSWHRLN
jgi:hypothetical protein